MAYTTINKSSDYFNTKLYTGNGSTNAITGVGFQSDWTWIKSRDYSDSHSVYDAVRGVTKRIRPNHTNAEQTLANSLTAFGSDGFTVGSDGQDNSNGNTYASWNWKANGQGSSNTDGSINTTYTSVNTTAGFSISQYTGTGSLATVGHGLGAVPKMVIVKRTDSSNNWYVYHSSLGGTKYLNLNADALPSAESEVWNNTNPTSSVFTVNTEAGVNGNGATFIAYCFAEKTGYSKFGSYVGNGNADGTFIYTGFKPAFVMLKITSAVNDWEIHDNKRGSFNVINNILQPNKADAESTSGREMDFLSNGFKPRSTSTQNNLSGGNFIYIAFAEAPLVGTNGVTAKAR